MTERRLGYALLGLLLAGLAIVEVATDGVGLWQLLVFAVLPDIALFVGFGGTKLERGQLHPRAVPLYNALHRFGGPLLLGGSAFWFGRPWLVAAVAWAAHVAFDRALGYGLRDGNGFQRRHLDEAGFDAALGIRSLPQHRPELKKVPR
jgi:Domain of unknown function (DUF4260)